jgi:hypothetical protein
VCIDNKGLQQSAFFKSFFLFFLGCLIYKLYKLKKVLYLNEQPSRIIIVGKEELNRFSTLSDKLLKNSITEIELLEFKKLLLSWNSYVELGSFKYLGSS